MNFPHRHVEGSVAEESADLGGSLEFRVASDESDENLPICHCHDTVAKTAEECDGLELALSSEMAGHLPLYEHGFFTRSGFVIDTTRAPPPGSELSVCFVLSRSRTGVYLI